MKSLTIEDIKKKKIALESDILDKLKSFEKEANIKVSYIEVVRKREKSSKKSNEVYEPYTGPIANIDIRMELDLVY